MFTPNYHISPSLLANLKRVAVLVHELNKKKLTDLVAMSLIGEARAQSAYASTTIEGNPLALTAVKALLKQSPKQLLESGQEVFNYNKALALLEGKNFSEKTVLDIHKQVLNKLIIKEKLGKYRKESVFIHNPKTQKVIFLPPDYDDVPKVIQDLYQFIDTNRDLDPVVLAGLFHKQFVLVHPFIDGSGRTVRLASTMLLKDLGINLFNLLSFENYYNQNVSTYFAKVGEQGNYYELNPNFTEWLEYFAEGIVFELQRLEKTLERTSKTSLNLKKQHHVILTYLEENGLITDKDYAQLIDRAKATRALDFKYLLELGLINRKGKGPATYYVLPDYVLSEET